MLNIKLPASTGEEGDDETAEEDPLEQPGPQKIPWATSLSGPASDAPGDNFDQFQLDKETVFEWFGLQLNPAKRIELMCGLLHMCQPLELRFLGSYLEDLARKDYHVLRDFEIRANSPAGDLGTLTDAIDPVVRSKLLVCLSLLGSDSRECAGILFRILRHIDPASFDPNDGYSQIPPGDAPKRHLLGGDACHGGGSPFERFGANSRSARCETAYQPVEQLALLFTMASLHPAFPFHQREMVRMQLDKIQLVANRGGLKPNGQIMHRDQKTDCLSRGLGLGLRECTAMQTPSQNNCSGQTTSGCRTPAVHIEVLVLKSISGSRRDKEYKFEHQGEEAAWEDHR